MIVIDAAALLALLLDEEGADTVKRVIRGSVMSAVNASECCSRAVERGGSAEGVIAIIRSFEVQIVPFDMDEAIAAAALRPLTRHVGASLGDRACLAAAQARGVGVYTGDRRLAELDIGVDVRLIR